MGFDLLFYRADQFTSLDIDGGQMITGATLAPIAVTVADDDGKINDAADPGLTDLTADLITSSDDPGLVGEQVIVDSGPGQTIQNMLYTGGRDINGDGGDDYGYVAEVTINGQVYIVTSVDNPLVPNTDYITGNPVEIQIESAGWGQLGFSTVTCFTRGTRISTSKGYVAVDDLRKGDLIKTLDHGQQMIRWIGKRKFNAQELKLNPKLRPVRILQGALGEGLPSRDVLLSRQHRVLMRSKISQRMFGHREVLIPAIKLTEFPGIFVDDQVKEVEYFHLLLDQHEVIFAENAPMESLFIGLNARAALGDAALREISMIFPELLHQDGVPSCRRFTPPGKKQKELVARHLSNQKLALDQWVQSIHHEGRALRSSH